jgi:hypothetical protein
MHRTVHSKIITANDKSYLFDIKRHPKGKKCLLITELVSGREGDNDINQIVIPKDSFLAFSSTIDEMQRYL